MKQQLKSNIPVTKYYWLLIILVLTITSYLRFIAVKNYNFSLTYDQGRDLMEITSIVIGHRPTFVGPTTSINGLFLGPFWFYFNSIPFALGKGNPQWIMNWQIFWYQITGLVFAWILKNKSPILGIVLSSLFLLMPTGFYTNHYFWNSNLMPIVIAWLMIILLSIQSKPTNFKIVLSGLISGLALQTQAALGVIVFPSMLITLLLYHYKFKQIKFLIIGFTITLIPQFIYEIRHGWIMSQLLYQQFSGQTNILNQSLPLTERITDRYQTFLNLIINTNHLPPQIVALFFLIAFLLVVFYSRKQLLGKYARILFNSSLILIGFSLILYLIYPQPIKHWFVLGLSVPLLTFEAIFLSQLIKIGLTFNRKKNFKIKRSPTVLLAVAAGGFIILTALKTTHEQLRYINQSRQFYQQDKSNLRNQIQVIDWVYQQAQGKGFWVYSYLPSVYDYAYQHIFWWYGTQTYGYQPEKITYADHVPAYIKSQKKLWTQTKPTKDNFPTFLIIEPDPELPERQQAWLSNFNHLCKQQTHQFIWNTRVEERRECK